MTTAINLHEFLSDVDKFGRKTVPEKLTTLHRKIALQALEGVVNRTPVDTGRARGNWQTTTGRPAIGEVAGTDQDGGSTVAAGLVPLAGLEPFSSVWITNNVPYIEELEHGSSAQAPAGMVEVTAAGIAQQFRSVK
ncbi:MAG: hypothetical protein VW405_00155 [Rhodospirillaceae bacterium]